jgi:hypothetical protein
VETADGSGETGLFDLIRQRDTHAGKTPDAYPWITFVLGSGCLATRGADQEGVDLDRFLRVGLEPVGDLVERYALVDLAKAFLVDLAALKLQQRPANETLAAESVTADEAKWPLAARAIVVAALATRLYTEGLNLTTRVLDRAERERDAAFAVNGVAPGVLADAAATADAALNRRRKSAKCVISGLRM